MTRLWTWVKRIGVALYVLIAGAAGGGGPVIADRKQMYGDDPRNDPYSPDYDPAPRPDLRR
jgi:hypothetical protein